MNQHLQRLLTHPTLTPEEKRRALVSELARRAKYRKLDWYEPRSGKQLDFHTSQARDRWIICGNRAGKTTAGCVEDLWWATGWHPYRKITPPCYVCVVTHSGPMQRSSVQPVFEKYLPWESVARVYQVQRGIWDRIRFKNQSILDFKTLDMGREKFQGQKWHLVHFDEEPYEDIHTEVARGLVDFGGSTIGTMSPINGMTWTYDKIFRNPEVKTFNWSMYDNPFLLSKDIKRFDESLTPEERLARIHGKYSSLSGVVYPEFDKDIHVIPEYEPAASDTVVIGIDTGRAFAAAFVAFTVDGRAIMFDEVYTEEQVTPHNAQAVLDYEKRDRIMPEFRFADSTSPFVRDLTSCGLMVQSARNDVDIGVNMVRRWMQPDKGKKFGWGTDNPRLYITANCQRAIWEIPRYQWARYSSRSALHGQLHPRILKRDDHMVDALRYAFTYIPEAEPENEVRANSPGITARMLLGTDEPLPDPFDSSFPRQESSFG